MVKHEISSVGLLFSVCVCARVNTASEPSLTVLLSLGTGRRSSTPTRRPTTTWSSSITETLTWSSLKTVGGARGRPDAAAAAAE